MRADAGVCGPMIPMIPEYMPDKDVINLVRYYVMTGKVELNEEVGELILELCDRLEGSE